MRDPRKPHSMEPNPSVRGLYKVLAVIFAVGILTGCRTLVTSFNRIHDMMTKEETPEETHYYGAFFTSPTVGRESAFRRFGERSLKRRHTDTVLLMPVGEQINCDTRKEQEEDNHSE